MDCGQAEKRRFLKTAFAGITLQTYGKLADAHYPIFQSPASNISIELYHIHTNETFSIEVSQFTNTSIKLFEEFNYFLRDHRQNESCDMDIKLLYQIYALQTRVNSSGVFEIIAGYRTQSTIERLRRNSKNVAKNSYHLYGRAIDLRLPGTSTDLLRDAAISMQAGGVGYYAKSNFIHLDTGPIRYWHA